MYNGKVAIAAALTTDGQLIALIPVTRMFDGTAKFEDKPVYPYLTFDEIGNGEALRADDEEAESVVTFRVHLWGKDSLSAAAGHVNRIMQALGYGRNYAQDQDETIDTAIIKHKIMSFSGTFTA